MAFQFPSNVYEVQTHAREQGGCDLMDMMGHWRRVDHTPEMYPFRSLMEYVHNDKVAFVTWLFCFNYYSMFLFWQAGFLLIIYCIYIYMCVRVLMVSRFPVGFRFFN